MVTSLENAKQNPTRQPIGTDSAPVFAGGGKGKMKEAEKKKQLKRRNRGVKDRSIQPDLRDPCLRGAAR